ncbi:MAG: conjugal transfer protein TraF [Gemmatimonadetes bacterium]|nr:conjugal transfer protein TraF [Gemmatimonadota bacterium]
MRTSTFVLAALALLAVPAAAQLPQASATALGLGFNTTASARGFAALANNPAGLSMDDGPGFSLAVGAAAVETGLGPISLQDLVDYEGQLVPDGIKSEWLQRVAESGTQAGTIGAGLTPVAFSVGSLGFQLSAQAGGEVNLGPDAVELLLYGNAGRTGSAGDYDLDGASLDAFFLSTAAVGYGFQVSPQLHLGVTGKYTVGTGLVVGRDAGSVLQSDPLLAQIEFPVLFTDFEDEFGNERDGAFNNGSGLGLDVGAIWVGPKLTVGATIQNLISTFDWDLAGFSYTPGQAVFDGDDGESNFDEFPADGAPQVLLTAAEELTLKPVFAAGVQLQATPLVRVTADLRKRASGGLSVGPDFHLGAGAELTALSFLPLRAHLAKVSEGVQVGGGASLVLGPVNLSGGIALRTGDAGDATLGMVTLSFGGN